MQQRVLRMCMLGGRHGGKGGQDVRRTGAEGGADGFMWMWMM
jgi:hypothetical protein